MSPEARAVIRVSSSLVDHCVLVRRAVLVWIVAVAGGEMRSLSGTFLIDAFTKLEFFDFMGLELRELLVLAGLVTLTRLGKGDEARCFR